MFVVDKSLLTTEGSRVSSPARYAAYSGFVSAAAAVLLFFAYTPPTAFIVFWSLLSGLFWVAALFFFFRALKVGEPSRVVPITGSAVPFFTLIFAGTVLGERLTLSQLIGAMLLILGGVFLSLKLSGVRGLSSSSFWSAVVGGAAFAAYFATVKYVYDSFDPFLAAFAYSRIGVGIVAGLLLVFVWYRNRENAPARSSSKAQKKKGLLIAAAFFFSKALGMAMLVLQNYAIDLGSVTIVNALQGTQYIFVLILAAAISYWFPKLFREELYRVAMVQKIAGIVCIGFGLMLIV